MIDDFCITHGRDHMVQSGRIKVCEICESAASSACVWVIPGDDTARADGSLDAWAYENGEFSKPLYDYPAPASHSSASAECLITRLVEAAVDYERAGPNSLKDARAEMKAAKEAVRSAIARAGGIL